MGEHALWAADHHLQETGDWPGRGGCKPSRAGAEYRAALRRLRLWGASRFKQADWAWGPDHLPVWRRHSGLGVMQSHRAGGLRVVLWPGQEAQDAETCSNSSGPTRGAGEEPPSSGTSHQHGRLGLPGSTSPGPSSIRQFERLAAGRNWSGGVLCRGGEGHCTSVQRGRGEAEGSCDLWRSQVTAGLPTVTAKGKSAAGGHRTHGPPHLSTALLMWAIQVFLSSLELV